MDNSRKQRKYSVDGFVAKKPQLARIGGATLTRKKISRQDTEGFHPRHSTALSFQESALPQPTKPVPAPDTPPFRSYSSAENTPKTEQPKLSKQTKKPQKRWKKILKRSSLATGAFALVAAGVFGWHILGSINKVFHGNLFSDAHALLGTTRLDGESQGRVNILLAGNSADDPGHGGAQLTDSIMIISLDTKHHTGFMLSIPRDTWVSVPGYGHTKINTANTVTSFNEPGYPRGGMGQLEEVIQDNFGIPINYYALIDYSAFRDAVNAVGGITINIQSPDARGLYDPNIARADGGPLKLPNGKVKLNGQTALNLARARGDSYYAYGFPRSDFDRTDHQRQMLTALEQKAANVGVLANPIKVSQLFSAMSKHVHTDMKIGEVLRAIQLVKATDISKMQSVAISTSGEHPLLQNYNAPNGQSALIPLAGVDNFNQIQEFYRKLISNDPVALEMPNVVILNGSSVTGLAHQEQVEMKGRGFDVPVISNTSTGYADSLIIDLTQGKKPASKQLLQKTFTDRTTTSTTSSQEAREATNYNADFIVIIGKNWATAHAAAQPASN